MPVFVDIGNQYTTVQSVEPDNYTVDTNGASLDCRDCLAEVTCIVMVGEVDGSDNTIDVHLESSPDDSTWTDITGATMTQITNAGHTHETQTFNTRNARYVRAVLDLGGTSPGVDAAVYLLARQSSY